MNNSVYGTSREEYVRDFLKIPNEQFRGQGKYYHYTSLENCIKLLEHEDGVFQMWASHLSFLNDKEEHVNGLNLIERKVEDLLLSKGDDLSDWIEDYKETRASISLATREMFVICFCSDRNLLSQWKYYGKNSGVAIQYNLDECEFSGYIQGIDRLPHDNNKYLNNYPNKVIYNNMEKQKIIDDFIEQKIYTTYDDSELDKVDKQRRICKSMDQLYSLAPLFKHDSFREESESRLLFRPLYMSDTDDASQLINYRHSDGRIIPYMKIKIRGKQEGNQRRPVIKSLTVGPGQNQELVFEALKHFVWNKFSKGESSFEITNRKDYSYIKINGIEIRKTSMPFRG